MARKAKVQRGAKSQAIRIYLEQHPNASAPDVVTALKGQGITVTPAFVYQLRSAAQRKARQGRRRRTTPSRTNGTGRVKAKNHLTAEQLLATKELADRLGGMASLRTALEVLEKL